jgi:hypothetical protein
MRDYSKVSPRFWTGETGKAIRKMGFETQVVAMYLVTGPAANMLGLYYLSMAQLCHESGSPFKGASKALRSLSEASFAYYDEHSEHVYLPNMAREQIGDRLSPKDNRHIAILRDIENYRKTPFFNDFVLRYREVFALHDVTLNEEKKGKTGSPFEAPSKPLRSQEQEQEQEHEQDPGLSPSDSVPQDGTAREGSGESISKLLNGAALGDASARVFDHWRTTHQHPRAQLDEKRRKVIRRALGSYLEADLCQAISGYLNSPHHMGENDRNARYDDIELFLRDAKHIDAGLKLYAEPPRTDLSEKSRRIVKQTEDWVPPETRHATS